MGLPTIVTTTSEKELKRRRMERAQQASVDPRSLGRSPNPEVEALFARNMRPGSPLLPKR
jgi:hypothetical protein